MAIEEITVDELAERLDAGARLIDVREPDEYERGHVEGAEPIPLATVPDHIDELRGETPLVVICHSGGRSLRACEYLAGEGIEAINVDGGTAGWIATGRPVST